MFNLSSTFKVLYTTPKEEVYNAENTPNKTYFPNLIYKNSKIERLWLLGIAENLMDELHIQNV